MPGEGEPGSETWSGDSYKTGGAPAWTIGAYDPELNTLYWTTGNPAPDWNGDARLGDNLYSDSVLAIDPDTGEMKWYFQFTPHDVWDYDGNTHIFLVDYEHEGETVKALVQANRNGFFYAINRDTGAFLRATAYVEQLNWATSMEPDGRPVVDVSTYPSEEPIVRICPGVAGGMNGAVSGALNAELGLAYIPVIESCQQMQKGISVYVEGQQFTGGTFIPVDVVDSTAYGHISAIDFQTGEIRWRYRGFSAPPVAWSSQAVRPVMPWHWMQPLARDCGILNSAVAYAASQLPTRRGAKPLSSSPRVILASLLVQWVVTREFPKAGICSCSS